MDNELWCLSKRICFNKTKLWQNTRSWLKVFLAEAVFPPGRQSCAHVLYFVSLWNFQIYFFYSCRTNVDISCWNDIHNTKPPTGFLNSPLDARMVTLSWVMYHRGYLLTEPCVPRPRQPSKKNPRSLGLVTLNTSSACFFGSWTQASMMTSGTGKESRLLSIWKFALSSSQGKFLCGDLDLHSGPWHAAWESIAMFLMMSNQQLNKYKQHFHHQIQWQVVSWPHTMKI